MNNNMNNNINNTYINNRYINNNNISNNNNIRGNIGPYLLTTLCKLSSTSAMWESGGGQETRLLLGKFQLAGWPLSFQTSFPNATLSLKLLWPLIRVGILAYTFKTDMLIYQI